MRLTLYLVAVLTAASVFAASQNPELSPLGLWLPKKKDTAVRIQQCGDTLCGYIEWLRADVEQVTPEGEPLCNTKVLWGFEQSTRDANLWKGGKIYRADEGDVFSGRLNAVNNDQLELRGYVGLPMFGKSYRLTRADPAEHPSCSATPLNKSEAVNE